MKIKQFEVPGLAQYSYVLSSEGQAIVIDPMRDFDRYTDYAAELSERMDQRTHSLQACCKPTASQRSVP